MSIPTADLYNQPAYSDIIISFSGRRVHCHKLVICSKSEYFKKLCDHNSGFSESTQNEIELKDDDPDALEHVLRYMYSGKHGTDQDNNWKLQLQIANSAHKYLLNDLANAAMKKFKRTASGTSSPKDVFETMVHIRKRTLLPDALEVAEHLETIHLHGLLKEPAYREHIEQDRGLVWNYLDQFNDTLVAKEAQEAELMEVVLRLCHDCRRYERFQIWVPRAELDKYRARSRME
ncbi:hypothetical protein BST61_g1369 [Cercospora zeina]